MPAASKLMDTAKADADAHGCPAGCPHTPIGPAMLGSANVFINMLPAVREQDTGLHAVCCGPNMWTATMGSKTVKVNGKGAIRKDDMTTHCGGVGKMTSGSGNVNIGG